MDITSMRFLFLFFISLGIYYAIPKKFQWYALLGFSVYFFCASSDLYTGVYLLASIITTTVCARMIGREQDAGNGRLAKQALAAGIAVNAGLLAVLKYSNFLVSNINFAASLIRRPAEIAPFSLAAPVGISFYTMQALGYLLDTYWGVVQPQKSMLKTALFIGYYPQLISGPISRYGRIQGQMYGGHGFEWDKVMNGLLRIVCGIFKKIVVSARLGVMVDTIYSDTAVYNGLYVWFAAAAFMIQLYTDFSGCMDIVLGVSECYGIVLPENFDHPFSAKSVQEFWQRWHMTLGAWLKDYILYPLLHSGAWHRMAGWLGKHFGKKAARHFPSYTGMLVVWLLIGLWHGGRWKYIIGMGIWFWLCIATGQVLKPVFKRWTSTLNINTKCASWRIFQSVRVFLLVSVGNMFFRLDGLMITLRTMKDGLHWNPWIFFDGSLYELGLDIKEWHILLLSLSVLVISRVIKMYTDGNIRLWLAGQNIVFRWACIYWLLFSIITVGYYGEAYDAAAFIYAGF